MNAPDMIRRLAERMYERGITPKLEIFDLGMADYLGYLLERDVLRPPVYSTSCSARSARSRRRVQSRRDMPRAARGRRCGPGRGSGASSST